jgi:hypothetical protein
LLDDIASVLYAHDPMGLRQLGAPENEYVAEARVILSRMGATNSERELQGVIRQVFAERFDPESAGSEDRYVALAKAVWNTWLLHQQS